MKKRFSTVLLALLAHVAARGEAPLPPADAPFDPTKVVGSDACAKCHQSEVNQWRVTPHCQTIDTLHRKPEADAIAERLGLRSVKRNDTCVRCHYTLRDEGGRVRIDSGVSCESCHGPARDWLELHADYGPGATRLTESPEHRLQRRTASVAAGMNNPGNLYLIARECLECHTTPDERLVDVGGHSAGSEAFSLVAWSQGIVRHNFVRSDGATNEVSPPERLRVMHVVGLMADLEASLRAVAKATRPGRFAQASALRAAEKKRQLWEVQRRIDDPLLRSALTPLATLELRPGQEGAIVSAADAVGAAALRFAAEGDGAKLAAIDDLLPTASQYK